MINVSKYVGLTREEALKLIAESGLRARVSSNDGAPSILTCDYRLDRVNLEVVDGKVVHASIG